MTLTPIRIRQLIETIKKKNIWQKGVILMVYNLFPLPYKKKNKHMTYHICDIDMILSAAVVGGGCYEGI